LILEVYSCGGGSMGKLGHGGEDDEGVPRRIEGPSGLRRKKVVGGATGSTHTVLWTEQGGVYGFGLGFALGLDPSIDECVEAYCPVLIEGQLKEKKVVGAAAGSTHTVVWTEKGEAFSFGAGRWTFERDLVIIHVDFRERPSNNTRHSRP